MKNDSWCSNVITYGLEKTADETKSMMTDKIVSEVLQDYLCEKCKYISRMHRLGKSKGNRPIIIYLQDDSEKKAIFANCKKLKGYDIYIQKDYSPSTLKKKENSSEIGVTNKGCLK